jgi:hypothetical protein
MTTATARWLAGGLLLLTVPGRRRPAAEWQWRYGAAHRPYGVEICS